MRNILLVPMTDTGRKLYKLYNAVGELDLILPFRFSPNPKKMLISAYSLGHPTPKCLRNVRYIIQSSDEEIVSPPPRVCVVHALFNAPIPHVCTTERRQTPNLITSLLMDV